MGWDDEIAGDYVVVDKNWIEGQGNPRASRLESSAAAHHVSLDTVRGI
ncbi:hypothetical protein ACFSND_12255 [Brevibacillus brevis]